MEKKGILGLDRYFKGGSLKEEGGRMPRRKRRQRGRILTKKDERKEIFKEEMEILSGKRNLDPITQNSEEERRDEKREKND